MIARAELSPFDHDAELYVLASLMVFPQKLPQVRGIVCADDFSVTNADVYAAIVSAADEGLNPDPCTIATRLKSRPAPDGSWPYYLAKAITEHTGVNAEWFARRIRDLAKKRRVQSVVDAMGNALSDQSVEPGECVSDVDMIWRESSISDLVGNSEEAPTISVAASAIRDLIHGRSRDDNPISTGLSEVDDLIGGGLHPGWLHIMAAHLGRGKTALALQMSRRAAEHGAVLYASLEMSRRDLLARLVTQEGEFSHRLLRDGLLIGATQQRAEEALDRISALPIRVIEGTVPTAEGLCTIARRCADRQRLALVVLDYLQMLRVSKGRERDTREQQVHHAASEMKRLAQELSVPVLAMSHLNKEGQLRESTGIGNDADSILVIEFDDDPKLGSASRDATITEKKGRHTGRGVATVTWEPRFVRFTSKVEADPTPHDASSRSGHGDAFDPNDSAWQRGSGRR